VPIAFRDLVAVALLGTVAAFATAIANLPSSAWPPC
jgi:hypothetical protein